MRQSYACTVLLCAASGSATGSFPIQPLGGWNNDGFPAAPGRRSAWPRIFRLRIQNVDGGVCVAEIANSIVNCEFTAAVDGLADQQDRTTVRNGLNAKQSDGEAQGIENGSSIVCGAQIVKGFRRFTVLHMMLAGAARSEVEDCLSGLIDVRGEPLNYLG